MWVQEVALIGMLGYLSYLAGELAGLSGIVTLFCCAVAISHYALHNIRCAADSSQGARNGACFSHRAASCCF